MNQRERDLDQIIEKAVRKALAEQKSSVEEDNDPSVTVAPKNGGRDHDHVAEHTGGADGDSQGSDSQTKK